MEQRTCRKRECWTRLAQSRRILLLPVNLDLFEAIIWKERPAIAADPLSASSFPFFFFLYRLLVECKPAVHTRVVAAYVNVDARVITQQRCRDAVIYLGVQKLGIH